MAGRREVRWPSGPGVLVRVALRDNYWFVKWVQIKISILEDRPLDWPAGTLTRNGVFLTSPHHRQAESVSFRAAHDYLNNYT